MLVTSGERFTFFDSEKNEVVRGPATPANLTRILPLALAPAEVVALLLGAPPVPPEASAELAVDEDERAYVLSVSTPALRQSIHLATRDLRVLRVDVLGAGGYRVDYDKFEDRGAGPFARRIRLVAEQSHARIEVSLSDVELNPAPDAGLFDWMPPSGVRAIEVDAAGRPVEAGQGGVR
jgi:hypothetical protein